MSSESLVDNRIPVNIITGFLGSGKTTLLNHWVNSPELKDTLVLINEFGDVGLDHELVESVDDTVVLLGSGCICCTLQGELVDSLAQNLAKMHEQLIPAFNRVLIETTGLADPSGVISTLSGDDFIYENYRYDGTVTVLDAVNLREQLKKQYEAVKQIALADLIIISKSDLVDADELQAVREAAQKINNQAPVKIAVKGDLDAGVMAQLGPYRNLAHDYSGRIKSWFTLKDQGVASPLRPAKVSDQVGVAKRRIIAHTDIDSFALTQDEPIEPLALMYAITAVQEQFGDSVLRIKGILNIASQEDPVVVHVVMGNIYPLSLLKQWPEGKRSSKLVFICRSAVLEQVRELFYQAFHHPDEQQMEFLRGMMAEVVDEP